MRIWLWGGDEMVLQIKGKRSKATLYHQQRQPSTTSKGKPVPPAKATVYHQQRQPCTTSKATVYHQQRQPCTTSKGNPVPPAKANRHQHTITQTFIHTLLCNKRRKQKCETFHLHNLCEYIRFMRIIWINSCISEVEDSGYKCPVIKRRIRNYSAYYTHNVIILVKFIFSFIVF